MNIATNSSIAIHKSDTFEVHRQADGMIAISRLGVPLESFDSSTAAMAGAPWSAGSTVVRIAEIAMPDRPPLT